MLHCKTASYITLLLLNFFQSFKVKAQHDDQGNDKITELFLNNIFFKVFSLCKVLDYKDFLGYTKFIILRFISKIAYAIKSIF